MNYLIYQPTLEISKESSLRKQKPTAVAGFAIGSSQALLFLV